MLNSKKLSTAFLAFVLIIFISPVFATNMSKENAKKMGEFFKKNPSNTNNITTNNQQQQSNNQGSNHNAQQEEAVVANLFSEDALYENLESHENEDDMKKEIFKENLLEP